MRPAVLFVASVTILLATLSRAQGNDADGVAIRKVDAEMVAALNARDVDRWLTYFATDARMMPPGSHPVVGKEAIRKLIAQYLATPGFSVAHHLESVVVSKRGDLAYVSYSYEMGKPVTETGKDISLYRRELDGSWKLIVDMWNENGTP